MINFFPSLPFIWVFFVIVIIWTEISYTHFFLNAGKNNNGRVCCMVKCSVVTRKSPASLQAKGASSESLPQTQQQCEKRLSLSDKLDQNDDNKFRKTFPMPSCSYQVDKDLTTSASPTSMVGFKSYFSNKYLARPVPRSAPTSNQTSPSHHPGSQYRLKGGQLPGTVTAVPVNTSMTALASDALTSEQEENETQENVKTASDAVTQKDMKPRHHSAEDTFNSSCSPVSSPKLCGKSSPGRPPGETLQEAHHRKWCLSHLLP